MDKQFKHLNLNERYTIARLLNENVKLANISETLGKDRSTISKEVKTSRLELHIAPGRNSCALRDKCSIKACKTGLKGCNIPCSLCNNNCFELCKEYTPCACERLNRFPWTCNGCNKRLSCRVPLRYKYDAKVSQEQYERLKTKSRTGFSIPYEELEYAAKLLHEKLILNKQPLKHIYKTNIRLRKMCSLSYLYSLVESGKLEELNKFSLPRAITYSPRKKSSASERREATIGRRLEDIPKNADLSSFTQMDTVVGTKGSRKVLLTFFWPKEKFMYAHLLPDHTARSVINAFNTIRIKLGLNVFKLLFENILTDNGSEFLYIDELENDLSTGEHLSTVYYCDPSSPYQKGAIEKNHEYIRMVLPKKSSFDDLTQEIINDIMSHINAVLRDSIGTTPYIAFAKKYGKETIKNLGLFFVDPKNVNLNPKFFK